MAGSISLNLLKDRLEWRRSGGARGWRGGGIFEEFDGNLSAV